MSEEELKEARSEFELALLFDKYQLSSGPGTLVKDPSGLYQNNYIEAAWRGFLMCWERQHDLLDRLDPMRYIGPGLVGAYKEHSEYTYDGMGTDAEIELWIQDDIRTALTVCRSTPA